MGRASVETAVGVAGNKHRLGSGTIGTSFVNGGNGQLNMTGGSSANLPTRRIGGSGGPVEVTVAGVEHADARATSCGSGPAQRDRWQTARSRSVPARRSATPPRRTPRHVSLRGQRGGHDWRHHVDDPGSLLDIGANGIGIGNAATASSLFPAGPRALGTANSRSRAHWRRATTAGRRVRDHHRRGIVGAANGYTISAVRAPARWRGPGRDHSSAAAQRWATAPAQTRPSRSRSATARPTSTRTGTRTAPSTSAGTARRQVTNGSALHSLCSLRVGWRGTTGSLLVDAAASRRQTARCSPAAAQTGPAGPGTITVQGGEQLASGGQHAWATRGSNSATTRGRRQHQRGRRGVHAERERRPYTVGRAGAGILTVAGGAGRSRAAYADTRRRFAGRGSRAALERQRSGRRVAVLLRGEAVLGGNNSGAGTAAGGTGTLNVTAAACCGTGAMAIFGGSA